MDTGSYSVSVSGVEKRFGSFAAVKGVTINVSGGDILLVLGPNGAGKSTLLKIIAGLYRPTKGKVRIINDGKELPQVKAREVTSFIGENYALYDDLTVKENLEFFAKLYGISKKDTNSRIRSMLNLLDAAQYLERRVGELSRGTKQKVSICRAFLNDPKILLLDEPTAFLDAKSMAKLHARLVEFSRQGRIIIYATQRLEELYRIGDKMLILSGGKTLASGPVGAAIKRLGGISVEIVTEGKFDNAALSKLLKKGWKVASGYYGNTITVDVGRINRISALVRDMVGIGCKVISVNYAKPTIESVM